MLKRRRPRLRTSSRRRPSRLRSRRRIAARQRRAASDSLLEDLIDVQAYVDTIDVLDRDEQSIELMNQIYEYFWDRLQLDGNESEALNRFMAVIKNGDRWDPALMRNNIFKAANSLGMKLPSGMF